MFLTCQANQRRIKGDREHLQNGSRVRRYLGDPQVIFFM